MLYKKNEFLTVPFITMFEKSFQLKENTNLLLDSIKVYGCKSDGCIDKMIGYDLWVEFNGKKHIVPIDSEQYTKYAIFAERYVKATVIQINANDYIDKIEHDGNYTFIFESEKVINKSWGNNNEQLSI